MPSRSPTGVASRDLRRVTLPSAVLPRSAMVALVGTMVAGLVVVQPLSASAAGTSPPGGQRVAASSPAATPPMSAATPVGTRPTDLPSQPLPLLPALRDATSVDVAVLPATDARARIDAILASEK